MWDEQCVTVAPPIDARDFRNALGAFPTGVCIITTCRPNGKLEGLTVSSFNTVSTAPPLVLWSMTRSSPSADAFRECGHLGISVLSDAQRDLSSHFSRRAEDKFAGQEHAFFFSAAGIPLLRDAVATFECRNSFQHYGGDHLIFVSSVERYQTNARPSLVFFRGRYEALSP